VVAARRVRGGRAVDVTGAANRGEAVDVTGAALLDWGGAPVSLHASWTTRPGGLHLHLAGTAGSVTVSGGQLTATVDGREWTETHRPPSAGDALRAVLAELRGEPPGWEPPTLADQLATARLIDQLDQFG
jgi:hypothetical protein